MLTKSATEARTPPVGRLLREWRAARHMSQLDLSLDAGMSSRHLSFIETGKASPSRDTITRLADALAVPLRERNALLRAAGFAPGYSENALVTPELDRMRAAIELIITHQEPYPAFVINRHFDVLMANQAAVRVNALLMEGRASPHSNLLHQVFDPDDFRPVIVNWEEVASKFVRHLQEEIVAVPTDLTARRLLDEILRYPGVPERWRFRDLQTELSPILTLVFRSPMGELRFFETITTLPHRATSPSMSFGSNALSPRTITPRWYARSSPRQADHRVAQSAPMPFNSSITSSESVSDATSRFSRR